MPILPWMGAISAGADLLSNTLGTVLGNKREDRNWEKMNQYNSPQAQMERLKAAGLNPNLVYGNGSAVATTNSAPKSQEVKPSNLSQGVMNYANIKQTQLQNDNLEAQNELIRAQVDKTKKEAMNLTSTTNFRDTYQTEYSRSQTALTNFVAKLREKDNDFYSTDKAKQYAIQDLEIARRNIENSYLSTEKKTALLEASTRITNLRANTRKTNLDSELLQIIIDIRKAGMNPNDSTTIQMLKPILGEATDYFYNLVDEVKNKPILKNLKGIISISDDDVKNFFKHGNPFGLPNSRTHKNK